METKHASCQAVHDLYIVLLNYRVRIGELDIIAMKQDVIVFVEVKTRKSLHCGFPAESVNFFKQQKIIKTESIPDFV